MKCKIYIVECLIISWWTILHLYIYLMTLISCFWFKHEQQSYSTSINLLKLLVIQYLLHQVILIYNVDDELESRCAFISNEYSVKTFKCQLIQVWYYNWSFIFVPILVICSWVFSLIRNADWQPILNNKTSIAPWSLYSSFLCLLHQQIKLVQWLIRIKI